MAETITIESLPREVLGHIFSYFCTHCTREVDTWFDGKSTPSAFFIYGYRPDRSRAAVKTLRNLCFVSRRIVQVAQEYLYHVPAIKHTESEQSWKLHKTFLRRPDLAIHLRILPFLPRIAAIKNILANARNLEVMLIQPGHKGFSVGYWEVAARDGGFPKLRTVVFERGFYAFDQVRYDKLLPCLSQSTPVLRTVDIHYSKRVIPPSEDFSLPTVTKLVLRGVDGRGTFHQPTFDNLIRVFPRITDFSYVWSSVLVFSGHNRREWDLPSHQTPFHHILAGGLQPFKSQIERLTIVSPCLRKPNVGITDLTQFGDFVALDVLISDAHTLGTMRRSKAVFEAAPAQIKELWLYDYELDSESDFLDANALKLAYPKLEKLGVARLGECSNGKSRDLNSVEFGEGIEVFQLPQWHRRM